jgi:hypothetical protein
LPNPLFIRPFSVAADFNARTSFAIQPIAPRHHFEFGPNRVLYRNYGARLELECRKHRAELVNRERIVAIDQQISVPIASTNHEELDFEIRCSLPLAKHFKDSFLCVFVLDRGTLRAFVPTDHVLHSISLIASDLAGHNRSSLIPLQSVLSKKFIIGQPSPRLTKQTQKVQQGPS